MAQTMRAVDIKNGAGPPSSLFISSSIPRPVPTAGQCLIRVHAFGLNRADTLQREGKYPVPADVTKTLGLEFSGTISALGAAPASSAGQQEAGSIQEHGHKWQEGDAVFGLTYGGAYAEYVVVAASMLLPKPAELSWEVCAGLCETWFTALQALHLVGEYRPGRTRSILWHAGASSVSIAGIQLSRAANEHHLDHDRAGSEAGTELEPPRVFATARQDDKCAFCVEKLGCTGAVNASSAHPKWAEELQAANEGKGFDLIVDYVGAPYFGANLQLAAQDGHIVQLGVMGGTVLGEGTDISAFLRKRVRFEGSTLRSRDVAYQGRLRDLFEERVLGGLRSGRFESHVDRVVSWKEIGKAHEALEGNVTKGKIVCVVD